MKSGQETSKELTKQAIKNMKARIEQGEAIIKNGQKLIKEGNTDSILIDSILQVQRTVKQLKKVLMDLEAASDSAERLSDMFRA